MINFNCKIKNRQTQIEGRGHEIQIWGHNHQIQIGAGGQGQGPRNKKYPKQTQQPYFPRKSILKIETQHNITE